MQHSLYCFLPWLSEYMDYVDIIMLNGSFMSTCVTGTQSNIFISVLIVRIHLLSRLWPSLSLWGWLFGSLCPWVVTLFWRGQSWARYELSGSLDLLCASQSAASPSVASVQGRLKQHKNFWLNELEPSSFVVGFITEGYHLPFLRLPFSGIIDQLVRIPHL